MLISATSKCHHQSTHPSYPALVLHCSSFEEFCSLRCRLPPSASPTLHKRIIPSRFCLLASYTLYALAPQTNITFIALHKAVDPPPLSTLVPPLAPVPTLSTHTHTQIAIAALRMTTPPPSKNKCPQYTCNVPWRRNTEARGPGSCLHAGGPRSPALDSSTPPAAPAAATSPTAPASAPASTAAPAAAAGPRPLWSRPRLLDPQDAGAVGALVL